MKSLIQMFLPTAIGALCIMYTFLGIKDLTWEAVGAVMIDVWFAYWHIALDDDKKPPVKGTIEFDTRNYGEGVAMKMVH